MDLKSIELQIAVPRTSEAGRVQHEGQHRPQIDQSMLSAQNVKDSDLQRHRSTEVDEGSSSSHVRRDDESSRKQQQGKSSGDHQDEKEKEKPAEHPYKGHHIDLSL
ncbi:hypothetical protein [Paenibacillus lutimineralis]|uniref:Uncharacterized protein n=1 Tax=Paenibacillus lutimineralis TaxID=2707005 RepID=A0A3S9V0L3_9BACL|nr:hypothetical protein [Paenibacillus lutimineralis]AZS16088.1 hypothetical protein EI981_17690 [Paenibacillus lutimineralis]